MDDKFDKEVFRGSIIERIQKIISCCERLNQNDKIFLIEKLPDSRDYFAKLKDEYYYPLPEETKNLANRIKNIIINLHTNISTSLPASSDDIAELKEILNKVRSDDFVKNL